jgi:hypothetical protein
MTDREPADDETPSGDPTVEGSERLVANAEVHRNAWERTLEDLRATEGELEDEGWDVVATAAGHTGPVAPEHDKGYWGLSYVLPESGAREAESAVEDAAFPAYEVYRNTVQGRVFAVVSYLDPDAETAVLVASNFRLRDATDLVAHAHDVGHLNSVLRRLDGTVIAQIRHDEPGKFFPRYDSFERYRDDWHEQFLDDSP